MQKLAALSILLGLASVASADRTVISGRNGYHFTRVAGPVPSAADTHIIFMNRCPGGCTVHVGNPDSRSDTSDIPNQTGILTQFNQSDAVWSQVMSCMRDTFSRFNVQIVDSDPGQTAHLEIMVAGIATQILGQGGIGVGGIADFPCNDIGSCDAFMPNALVFAFANDPYYAGAPLEICSTAAQEIAHTWGLDHVVDATDPMTYNPYDGMREYRDHQRCGSDCQNGQSPFGLACTGTGGQATHLCAGTGMATQDEVATITALFGTEVPDTTPPSVAITAPANGASVMPGFTVTANVTDDVAVASAELAIDGMSIGTLSGAPFSWTAPQSLTQGSHHVQVTGTDLAGNTATAEIQVVYGSACHTNADCGDPTQICDNGHCAAGPTTPGGLGSPCTANTECASNQCGDDGQGHMYCVEACDPTANHCPSGFGCVATGAAGVCWPGADNGGGGGCNTGGGAGLSLALLALAATRRRRLRK